MITSGSRDWAKFYSDFGDPFVRIANLDRGNLNLRLADLRRVDLPDAPEGERAKVSENDLLLSITAYLGSIAVANQEVIGGYVSQHIALARLDTATAYPKWVGYCLLSDIGQEQLIGDAYGGTKVQLALDDIRNLWFPLPPTSTQEVIADYLDRETARIDALVGAKESMLQLLEQKHAAMISSAVTRGLDPKVSRKPSGLEWLGEIPGHWQIERGKNLFAVRDERSADGEEELLTVSHITGVTSRAEKEVNMFKADDMTGYKRCMKGDFATNTLWAWMGAMGISPLDGIVSPDYHVYTSKGQILPEFMELLCRSKPFVAEVIRWSKGVWSSRLRLYPENFFEIRFPVPPKKEQEEIVAAIATYMEKTAELADALVESIKLLKERRSALITAAVTGRLDSATLHA